MSKIGYVDIKFNKRSEDLLDKIIEDIGLKKDFKDEYHCTIAHSKKPFDIDLRANIKENCTIKGFGNFNTDNGLNLHVELDCLFCQSEFKRCIKNGAFYDHPKYIPHITLLYNCEKNGTKLKVKDLKRKLDKYIGLTLDIISESKSKLNKNWLKDN